MAVPEAEHEDGLFVLGDSVDDSVAAFEDEDFSGIGEGCVFDETPAFYPSVVGQIGLGDTH